MAVIQSKDFQKYLLPPIKDIHQIKSLFSVTLRDYSLDRPDWVPLMQEINAFLKNEINYASSLYDPGSQYLKVCSPLVSPRNPEDLDGGKKTQRDMPSPAAGKTEKNDLLLQYYQELSEKEYNLRQDTLKFAREQVRQQLVK